MNKYKNGINYWASNGTQATRLVIPNEARPTYYQTIGLQQFNCGVVTENVVFQVPITHMQMLSYNNMNIQTVGGIRMPEITVIQPALYWQKGG